MIRCRSCETSVLNCLRSIKSSGINTKIYKKPAQSATPTETGKVQILLQNPTHISNVFCSFPVIGDKTRKKEGHYERNKPDNQKLNQLGSELHPQKCYQPGGELYSPKLMEVASEIQDEKLQQVAGEVEFPSIFASILWMHHVLIIQRCSTIDEALFYFKRIITEGLSRSALENYLRTDLYHTTGTAETNFDSNLPEAQSKLARELLKGNYDLGFISLPADYDKTALEDAIEQRMTRFLLEIGNGWAFVGRQKEIIVSGKTRRIDLLFYHIYLRCYVVLELKVKSFEPEFAGKLNFYVNAVNEFIRRESDNPTLGLLICKDMDRLEVRLAFQGNTTPMGVATYDNIKIADISKQLPTPEQIRQQIEIAEEEFRSAHPTGT